MTNIATGMRDQVEAKLKQANEQSALWQRNLSAAQEQVIRWDTVSQVCRKLLAEAVETEAVLPEE